MSNEAMDKVREEFEAWFRTMYFHQETSDTWTPVIKECMWLSWQASRAALVVELKQSSRVGDSDYGRGLVDGSAIYKIYVEGQLDNAGIKWTE